VKPSPPNFNATAIFLSFNEFKFIFICEMYCDFFVITKRLKGGEGFTKSHPESLYSLIYGLTEVCIKTFMISFRCGKSCSDRIGRKGALLNYVRSFSFFYIYSLNIPKTVKNFESLFAKNYQNYIIYELL
jgi:hypothetical protein